MKKKIPIVLLSLLLLISCKQPTPIKQKKVNKYSSGVYVYFNDTLKIDSMQYGMIRITGAFDDTIKYEDKRAVIRKFYLNNFDLDKNIYSIKEDECNFFYNGDKDSLWTFVGVKPIKKGKSKIAGFINYTVFIDLKDSLIRQIEKDIYFEKDVFIVD